MSELLAVLSVIGLFSFGAVIGSFLNVVILRFIAGEEIVRKRSHCPACRHELTWYELIPILSFVLQRGRCRSCRAMISVQYPVVEFVSGILLTTLLIPLPYSPAGTLGSALLFTVISLLIVMFVIDLKTFLLPDVFVILLGIVVIAWTLVPYAARVFYPFAEDIIVGNDPMHVFAELDMLSRISGAAVGGGFLFSLWLITRGRGIGLGDVKLAIPLGFLFGPQGSATLLFIAFIIGGLVAVYLLLMKKAKPKTPIPFGPFLCGTSIVLLIWPMMMDILWHLIWPAGGV